MGEKIARAGGWECSWNCNVGERERRAGTHLGERARGGHLQRHKLEPFPRSKSKKNRGDHTRRACVGATLPQVGGWYLSGSRPPPRSPQKFCRSRGNELSSQIKHEMGAASPLGRTPWFSYLSTTVSTLYIDTHTGTHTHTQEGGRQKSLTQNKGIIIPYREKWSLHFPARFRSLI